MDEIRKRNKEKRELESALLLEKSRNFQSDDSFPEKNRLRRSERLLKKAKDDRNHLRERIRSQASQRKKEKPCSQNDENEQEMKNVKSRMDGEKSKSGTSVSSMSSGINGRSDSSDSSVISTKLKSKSKRKSKSRSKSRSRANENENENNNASGSGIESESDGDGDSDFCEIVSAPARKGSMKEENKNSNMNSNGNSNGDDDDDDDDVADYYNLIREAFARFGTNNSNNGNNSSNNSRNNSNRNSPIKQCAFGAPIVISNISHSNNDSNNSNNSNSNNSNNNNNNNGNNNNNNNNNSGNIGMGILARPLNFGIANVRVHNRIAINGIPLEALVSATSNNNRQQHSQSPQSLQSLQQPQPPPIGIVQGYWINPDNDPNNKNNNNNSNNSNNNGNDNDSNNRNGYGLEINSLSVPQPPQFVLFENGQMARNASFENHNDNSNVNRMVDLTYSPPHSPHSPHARDIPITPMRSVTNSNDNNNSNNSNKKNNSNSNESEQVVIRTRRKRNKNKNNNSSTKVSDDIDKDLSMNEKSKNKEKEKENKNFESENTIRRISPKRSKWKLRHKSKKNDENDNNNNDNNNNNNKDENENGNESDNERLVLDFIDLSPRRRIPRNRVSNAIGSPKSPNRLIVNRLNHNGYDNSNNYNHNGNNSNNSNNTNSNNDNNNDNNHNSKNNSNMKRRSRISMTPENRSKNKHKIVMSSSKYNSAEKNKIIFDENRKQTIESDVSGNNKKVTIYGAKLGRCISCFLDDRRLVKISEKCSHAPCFCLHCYKMMIETQLQTLADCSFHCQALSCNIKFEYDDYHMILSERFLSIVDKLLTHRVCECLPEFRWCKNNKGCGSGQLISNYDSINTYYTCRACDCKLCFKHDMMWHEGYTCDEFDAKIEKKKKKRQLKREKRENKEKTKSKDKDKDNDGDSDNNNSENENGNENENESDSNSEIDENEEAFLREFSKLCPNCDAKVAKLEGCDVMCCCQYGVYGCRKHGKDCNHGGKKKFCGQLFCWKCLGKIYLKPNGEPGYNRNCKSTCIYADLND